MAILLTVRPPGEVEPKELTFDQQRVRIGRGAMCDVRLPHRAVSSVHAMITLERDRYFLVDPGSTNGTMIGDEVLVIERRKLLRSGDMIAIAGFEIEFRSGVAMISHQGQERTASVARQLARHVMVDNGFELRCPALVVLGGPQEGERFELGLQSGEVFIGRADENDIVLDDREASRQHVVLDVGVESVVLRDLGGKNPVLVNERDVTKHRLRDRDEVLIGATRLVYDEPVEAYLRELAQSPDAEMPTQTPTHSDESELEATDEAADDSRAPSESSDDEGIEDDETERAEQRSEGDDRPSEESATRGEVEDDSRVDESSNQTPSEVSGRLFKGGAAGAEIAILLVGALILATCIAALVWIFR